MLEKGFNYLLYEEKASITYELVAELSKQGDPVLCITTIFPKKLKKMYNMETAEILWLTDSGSDPKALKPTRLDFEITRSITKFFKNNEGSVVFLDGFEYLLSENGFDKARRFIKRINDTASMTDGTFIICVNKDAIPREDLITLSKDFDIVKEARVLMDGGKAVEQKPASPPPVASAPAGTATQPQSAPKNTPSTHGPMPATAPPAASMPSSMPSGEDFPLEIEDIYLIHRNAGILLQRKTWRDKDVIDPDLVAGMFQGVLNFVNDSFSSGERSKFSRMDIKGNIILVYDSELVSLAIVLAGEDEGALYRSIDKIRNLMKQTAESIEKAYHDDLATYRGDVSIFKGSRKFLDYLGLAIYDAMSTKIGEDVDMGPMIAPEIAPEKVDIPLVEAAEDFMTKASVAARSGKYDEALKYYDEALKTQPNNLRALFNKGVMLHMIGKPAEAVQYYDKYLEINPYDPEAWSNKGMALRRTGNVQGAIKAYEKGIELNPDDATLWSNKGIALRSIGKVQEAIECYDRALTLNPNDAGIWSNKGVALQSIGRLQEAIECYDRALAIDPRRRVPLQNREIAMRQLNQRGRF